ARRDAAVVALVDLNPDAAEAMKQRYALDCPVFTDLREAIGKTNANLVFDVTIPASHYEIRTAAVLMGCDVFGEKPLAETMRQCNDIVSVSDRTGHVHAVMQNRRYNPGIRSLQAMLRQGVIGKAGYYGADFFLGPHFGGFRDA